MEVNCTESSLSARDPGGPMTKLSVIGMENKNMKPNEVRVSVRETVFAAFKYATTFCQISV